MQRSRQALGDAVPAPATREPSPVSRSRPSRVSVRIAGPSESFIRRSRNPDLESPWRFVPTVKGVDDVVI